MDFTKFFTKVVDRWQTNLIRELTEVYMRKPKAILLAGGMPNTETFPYAEISVTYKDGGKLKLTGSELNTSLQYGPSQGYLPLIKLWREFQEKWHSPMYKNWDVSVTAGSQDACSRLMQMFIDNGEPVMAQVPAYTAVIGALSSQAPDFIEIEQDDDGIIPEHISKACKERLGANKPLPKLLYVNPTGSNPAGTNLPDKRKREIYELAKKYNFLILEDDAYYFVHFLDKQPISFLSLDTDGRVIRLDTFSKILSSGLRLGTVSAHKAVIEKFNLHVQQSTLHASSLSQMLLYKILESWDDERFKQHIREIQSFYRQKRDIILAALEKHLQGLAKWSPPKGGMFVWLKLVGLDDAYDLTMKDCVKNNLLILPGTAFNYDPKKPSPYIRLSYSYATPEEVDTGLSILATLIREKLERKNNHVRKTMNV